MPSVKRRPYKAPRREAAARETKARIAAAARALFASRGYAGTTLEAVAEKAGVAVQTVYASFGSKRAILSALTREMEMAADLPEFRQRIREAKDPREQLRLAVEIVALVFAAGLDVLEIARAAGSADADIDSASRAGEARRRAGQSGAIRAWAAAGVLRPGLAPKEALDIMWSLTAPDLYRLLVVECRWSVARYRRFVFGTLEGALFSSAAGRRR